MKPINTYKQFGFDEAEEENVDLRPDPRTLESSWYLGNISKRETEGFASRLTSLPPGAFFVRDMKSSPGCFGLVTVDHTYKVVLSRLTSNLLMYV
jgi:hypothetical protein